MHDRCCRRSTEILDPGQGGRGAACLAEGCGSTDSPSLILLKMLFSMRGQISPNASRRRWSPMMASKPNRTPIVARTPRPDEVLARAAAGTRIHLRRRQHLPLERFAAGELLRVERGCLILQAPRPDGRSRVALLLFAGDVISREAVPPLSSIGLTAASPATIQRLGAERDKGTPSDEFHPAVAFARLSARTALHAITLNELTAEQRIATFLVEMALRFGSRTPNGCAFELPLSRTDIARYLALNPDTMSRLMSRLRAKGLLSSPTRGWATVQKLDVLAATTPLASTLRRLWPASECGAGIDIGLATAP